MRCSLHTSVSMDIMAMLHFQVDLASTWPLFGAELQHRPAVRARQDRLDAM